MPAHASISRRRLLAGHAQALPLRTLPPGALPENLASCTGCGQCVDACPQDILTIRDDAVLLVPEQGECTFCNACADACPEPVFVAPRVMAHLVRIGDDCLTRAGIACMSCRDMCPEAAIRMQPRIGAPFHPVLDAALCTGCGACIAPCPADAIVPIRKEPADA
jgi:ferredoxin-type protein NapF